MVVVLSALALICAALLLRTILPRNIAAFLGRVVGRLSTLVAVGIVIGAIWMLTGATGGQTDALYWLLFVVLVGAALVLHMVGGAFSAAMSNGDDRDASAP